MTDNNNSNHDFENKGLTRRQFISGAAAMGLYAAASPIILPRGAQAAAPRQGGLLKMGIGGCSTTDSLDVGKLSQTMPQNVNVALRNALVEMSPDNEPVPELAESWEASPDAKQWVVKLRKGVEFHNGKTMTSEDVIYSFQYHMGEDSKSAAKAVAKPIKNIRADGKYTVIFELNEGNADFPYILSDYHFSIVPAGTTGDEFEKGIGTGPFIFESYEPGVRFYAKRNPNYFKEGLPYFDEVEMLGISDVSSRTNALKTGRIHVMNRCDVKTFHLFERMPGIQTLSLGGPMHYTIPMRTDMAPFNDNNVRLGLKHAIDREKMLKLVLKGYGYVGNDHPISKITSFYADLPQRQYDPDKAKFYLKKAGMENETFKLHTSDAAFSGAVDAAVLYKETAAEAGINIEVVKEPSDGYWSNVWTKKGWCFSYWGGRPTADSMFSVGYAEGAAWNATHFSHKRFNELLTKARAELDTAKRQAMYTEMQEILKDEGGVVVPVFADYLTAASDKLGHNKVAANWEFDGMKLTERWWMKK